MSYEILTNTPIPETIRSQWPFKTMKPGEALKFTNEPEFRRASAAAYSYQASKKKDVFPRIAFKIKWYKDAGKPRDISKEYGHIWRVS